MKKSNVIPSLGLLFTTTTALVSPVHETIMQKPLYGSVPPLTIRSSLSSMIRKLMTRIDVWRQRATERKQLGHLSDQMLMDLGLDRSDVADELAKPFWRP